SPVGRVTVAITASPPGSGRPVPNDLNRYFAIPCTSPRPDELAAPCAKRMSPTPLFSDAVPENFTATSGTFGPMSKLSVTPIRANTTVVVELSARFAVPDRDAAGDAAVVVRTWRFLSIAVSLNRSYVDA